MRLTPARKALISRASNPRCAASDECPGRGARRRTHQVFRAWSSVLMRLSEWSSTNSIARVVTNDVIQHAHCGCGKSSAGDAHTRLSSQPLFGQGQDHRPSIMGSTPPSPPMPRGYLSGPFERFIRDDGNDQWASAFTLLGSPIPLLYPESKCGFLPS